MKRNKMLIITGVSASGKTVLQEDMLQRGFNKPINFTTREPRYEDEVDDYVFLDEDRFIYLLRKDIFIDHTNWYWNWYGISRTMPKWDICMVLDPIWREQIAKWISRDDYDVKFVYLDIDEKLQTKRLNTRWDSKDQRALRKKDFEWFSPSASSVVLDGAIDTNILADKIKNSWEHL